MRLIDADSLLKHLFVTESRTGGSVYAQAYEQGWDDALKAVMENEPTVADVVDVVRCKDCKHRPVMVWSNVYDDFDVLAPEVDGKEDWRCPCLIEDDPYYSWSPNDNWFCGNGERRESDGNGK